MHSHFGEIEIHAVYDWWYNSMVTGLVIILTWFGSGLVLKALLIQFTTFHLQKDNINMDHFITCEPTHHLLTNHELTI